MSEEIKLKLITIKTETGSKWFDDPVLWGGNND
jgi:hypothetical protein